MHEQIELSVVIDETDSIFFGLIWSRVDVSSYFFIKRKRQL